MKGLWAASLSIVITIVYQLEYKDPLVLIKLSKHFIEKDRVWLVNISRSLNPIRLVPCPDKP